MLKATFVKRRVWKRLIPFQVIPLVGTFIAFSIANGGMETKSQTAVQLIFFVGFLMYATIMAFLVQCFIKPEILSIDDFGNLSWRPAFSTFKTKVPEGARIDVEGDTISINPSVTGIPASSSKDGVTTIKLPMGVETVYDKRTCVIYRERSLDLSR